MGIADILKLFMTKKSEESLETGPGSPRERQEDNTGGAESDW